MSVLLQVDFDYSGPFGQTMADAMTELAASINQEPGFLWKIWTESEKDNRAGGIYMFEDYASAAAYLDMHSQRLQAMGLANINSQIFQVNEPLSKLNQALQ